MEFQESYFPSFQKMCVPLFPAHTMSFQPLLSRSVTRICRPMPGPFSAIVNLWKFFCSLFHLK